MMCSECHVRPSIMDVKINDNGNISILHLCQECAAKRGLMLWAPFSLADVFPHTIRSGHDELCCKRCGMTLSGFKKAGVVGCQECYQNLRTGTEPVLRQVQKGMKHTGRTPVGHAAAKLAAQGAEETPPDEWERLSLEMNAAVACENFEKAAELRDQMHRLEQERKESNLGKGGEGGVTS